MKVVFLESRFGGSHLEFHVYGQFFRKGNLRLGNMGERGGGSLGFKQFLIKEKKITLAFISDTKGPLMSL